MKKAREHGTRKGVMLQQCIRSTTGIKRLRGRHHDAPAPSFVIPERGRLGNALVVVLALALLLFSLLGMVTAITGVYALTPHQLSARSLSGKPTGTPSPRHSPTPTALPSPTAPATLSPSPTFTAPPTMIATVIATAPTSAPPPVKATTPSPTRKPRVSQRQTPVSPPSTGSPAVQPPSRNQQLGRVAFLPLLVMGILSGIATFALLVAVGIFLLRKWLMPVRKVKLPPSGAAPWQRVHPTSLPGSMNSSASSMQPFPTTDASLPAARNSIPSRKGFPSPTSNGLPLEAQTKHE
jgi:hypothetical protein